MLLRSIIHMTLALAASGAVASQAQAQVRAPAAAATGAAANFTVGNIRVEGLQRISEGTVYNYLPVNIGDRLDRRRIDEALKALYATGFFRDVQLRRDGGTLRPRRRGTHARRGRRALWPRWRAFGRCACRRHRRAMARDVRRNVAMGAHAVSRGAERRADPSVTMRVRGSMG